MAAYNEKNTAIHGNKRKQFDYSENASISFVIKGASLCLSLATTPTFIRYFHHNAILGVWYTLLSVLLWVLNFDLGIGNGIRNNLVDDFSHNDMLSARKTLSSGIFSSALLMLALTATGIMLIECLDLNWLFHVDETILSHEVLVQSARLTFIGIMVRFFLTCITSVFYALQMSSVNHFLGFCVSILQLLFVKLIRPENPQQGLLWLSGAYAVISNLPLCIAGALVFRTKLKTCIPSVSYIDRQHIRSVMGTGTIFFFCQITYMLLMNTNEFCISRLFGPEYTTEYTFYYRLTSLISMLVSLILTPMWSVITKAMGERQYDWVRKLYKKLKITGALIIIIQFGFVFVQQFVMDFWLGKNSVIVDYPTAIAFASFDGVCIYTSILSTMVCGMSRLRLQIICYSLGVLGKFFIIFMMTSFEPHWSIVIWSNVVVLLPYCIIQQVDLDRYFRNM